MKLAINIILTVAVIGLAVYLYIIIREPIEFEKVYRYRKDKTVERLVDIREAQMAYRDAHGGFAENFNKLIGALKRDSLPSVKIIGNPDDTTRVTLYDTTYVPLWSGAFEQNYPFDSLRFIPFSGGTEFEINAGTIQKNRVTIPVFEVSAPNPEWLKGLDPDYIDKSGALTVGSMTEGTYSGNWGE